MTGRDVLGELTDRADVCDQAFNGEIQLKYDLERDGSLFYSLSQDIITKPSWIEDFKKWY